MTIRTALPKDAFALSSLLDELGYSGSPDCTIARLRELSATGIDAVFIAEDGAAPVGCVHVGKVCSLVSPPRAEVHSLVVTERVRGCGVGRLLVERAEQWAVDEGITRVRVGTRIHRTGAHAFYTRLGYTLSKEHRIYEREVGIRV